MTTSTCFECQRQSVRASSFGTKSVHLSGSVTCYKDGVKIYLRECCLESYLVGSTNEYISKDKRDEICSKYKGATYKNLWIDSVPHRAFELKDKKCLQVSGTLLCRQVYLRECSTPYKLYSNAQIHRLIELEEKAASTRRCDIEMGGPGQYSPAPVGYVYMLQDCVSVSTGDSVFKIGRTTQVNGEHFKPYTKGFHVYMLVGCFDCHAAESAILRGLRTRYRARVDYGLNSFEGDCFSMMRDSCTQLMYPPSPDEYMGDADMSGPESYSLAPKTYVYLLRDRTAIATGDSVYKVGKTTQHNFERFRTYPKGYHLCLLIACNDCHSTESKILSLFMLKYKSRPDYDTESFEGDCYRMMIDICGVVFGG